MLNARFRATVAIHPAIYICACAAPLLVLVGRLAAQQSPLSGSVAVTAAIDAASTRGLIPWKSGPAITVRKSADELRQVLAAAAASDQRHIVVQFERPLLDSERAAVEAAGLQLLAYVSDNAFFAASAPQQLDTAALLQLNVLRDVLTVQTEWKLHEDYLSGTIQPYSVAEGPPIAEDDESKPQLAPQPADNPTVAAYVVFHPDVDLAADAPLAIQQHGGRVITALLSVPVLVVEVPWANIPMLAAEDAVQWIEPPLPRFSELNNSNRERVGADAVAAPPYDLDGSGVTVMVYDGGQVLNTHPDLVGRVSNPDTATLSNHSTHVAGTIGGTGAASSGLRAGMAPGVRFVSYAFENIGEPPPPLSEGFLYSNPGDLESNYTEANVIYGAEIANNSIGSNTAPNGFDCNAEGNYGVTDTLIDAIARGSLGGPFRIVWANGNERQTTRCTNTNPPGVGTYHSTAPPACAKNHVTVGAINSNDDSMTTFSSWGPADDGRMKPDIVGPGCQSSDDNGVTSCSTSTTNPYNELCCTSMACPTVCGVAALMMEDFRTRYPGRPDFRNSTLKILLAHSAVDLGNPGPDYQYGYGSVRAPAAIDLLRSGNFMERSLTQGSVFTFYVAVEAGAADLKVTLAWDDVPGTPNVDPALVNDLDVRVFDPGNVRHYPWTLAGLANPAANAVQTAEDHLNNIEQVYIANPLPGLYRVEIVGTNIPQGPQPYSVAATPRLLDCSSRGAIGFDRPNLRCADVATIRVTDCDLNTNDAIAETVSVIVTSTSEPAGETLLLTETAANSANFVATLPLSTTDAPGTLLIAAGDAVTATYIDADNGSGGTNLPVNGNAAVDCQPPVASNIQITNLRPRSARISFSTSEPTIATLRYGTNCAALTPTTPRRDARTAHTFVLENLVPDTTQFFVMDIADAAGNAVSDNNGGACHSFTTPPVPDFYTEQFTTGLDLANKTMLFTPDGSISYYSACISPSVTLPTDPSGGTSIALTNTNSIEVPITAPGVLFYGVNYSRMFVGSNGYVTFTASDTDASETFADHFDTPRISGLFDDLNPAIGGQASWKRTADRIAVTYLAVAEATTGVPNTFQIELFFDGRIQITWLTISVQDAIVGLSAGGGPDQDFAPSDLSAFGICPPRPPTAASITAVAQSGRPSVITLIAGDDGLPNPPGATTHIITALPQYALRDAGNDHVISANELPYTLVNGGNEVEYQSANGFVGPDSFQFRANDGGTPPDGGDSLPATISINVEPVLSLPFTDTFATTTFDAARWGLVSGATIDTLGLNPPSVPNSARFNGSPTGRDEIRTHVIDLSGVGIAQLSYGWQCRGGGESPDANEDLWVEFLRADGNWQIIRQYPGSTTPDMTTFTMETLQLPAEALHDSFRLRIRNFSSATTATDDWFVDNISIISLETPTASAAAFEFAANRTSTINLAANDPNGDPLDYVILSLPSHGQLLEPADSSVIAAVPYTLAAGGGAVRYRADLGYIGGDGFTFRVNDGENDSNTAPIDLTIGGRILIHSEPLNTSPGWTTEGLWAFGQPTGGGTQNRDPTSGFTGPNVYGYNLNGNYENGLVTIRYLRSTAFDCTALASTQLRFRRWLGIESASFDHANIQASNNGTAWVTVWNHTGNGSISETAWSYQMYDMAAVADNQPTVFVRWGMGPTDAGSAYPGWNIDDVEIWGVLPPTLPGDANCDGAIDFFDIDAFLAALFDPAAYPTLFPGCDLLSADVNRDGLVNFVDIDPFVDVLFP